MLGVLTRARQRYLVCAPRALDLDSVDLRGPGPAFWRAQDDCRPARALARAVLARLALEPADVCVGLVHRRRQRLMNTRGLVAADEDRAMPVAAQQVGELVVADAGEHGRIGDLPAVQMQDRQHRSVGRRIEELVRVPAGRKRARLCLAVADHAGDEQIRVVESGAIGVAERVAELSALVNRSRSLGRDMARHSARERELPEELLHAGLVLRDRGPVLRVGALEPCACAHRRAAVPGPGDEQRVRIVQPDEPVDMRVEQIEAGCRSPVAEQAGLYVLGAQGLAQQRVGEQVDLPDREVVGRAPPGVEPGKVVGSQGFRGARFARAAHG